MKEQRLIKWVGGKTALMPAIKRLVLPNQCNALYDPFTGGGAVWQSIGGMFKHVYANDYNDRLMNLWHSVKHDTEAFKVELVALFSMLATEELYYRLRDEFNSMGGTVRHAALFVWLNKHCFNGLFRVNANGGFNASWGKRSGIESPVGMVDELATKMANVSLSVGSARSMLDGAEYQSGSTIYLDPPYIPVVSSGVVKYAKDAFSVEDLLETINAAIELAHRNGNTSVIISNSDCDEFRQLVKEADELHAVSRSGQFNCAIDKRGKVSELIAVFRC